MAERGSSFRKFLLLWSGELVSAAGSGLTAFGLSVYVFRMTGQASAVALVALLAFLPSLLLSAPAGVLADRYDRRLLMVAGDLLSALGPLFLLWCFARGEAALWQICVGVTLSSAFSALLEPAYRASITDLLSPEEYTKAAGLVNLAASAKYLVSPVLAGFLLVVSDIRLLLAIDAATFFLTCVSTLAVRRGLPTKRAEREGSAFASFAAGWNAIARKRGVLVLVFLTSVVTFLLGVVQTLSAPMILSFAGSAELGSIETISATGMLAGSVLIAVFPLRRRFRKILSASLFAAGLCLALFGLRENAVLICASGFLFFASLPATNACLDYLVRTNLDNSVQGRAWGLIGFLSQAGYAVAYASVGFLSDAVFTPLLVSGGALSGSVGRIIGTGAGRGAGFLVVLSGLLLSATSIALYASRSIKGLENGGNR